ncbi:MAG: Twin-arginine translocation pathway signal [Granulosicoccus sp.]
MNTTGTVPVQFSTKKMTQLGRLTRRDLLKRSLALSTGLLVGNGFLAGRNAAWALETQALEPNVLATLVQMARDIYPHDRFGDNLYAIAVKGHDEQSAQNADYKLMIEAGIASLDARARAAGFDSYLDTGWESDRLAILRSMESDAFFQKVRGGLVVSLYNQPAVWELLGYEGSSFEKGGYLERGFDDIDWL